MMAMRFGGGWRVLALAVISASVSCGGDKIVQGPTTVIEPPQIACPAPITQVAPLGQPISIVFQPTVSQGAEPVTTACSPASGSSFNLGTTPVACTATDARQRSATCSFSITVQPPPRISATRFLAFGDSITFGEDGTSLVATPQDSQIGFSYPGVQLTGRDYPTVLQQLLAARYTAQTLTVINDGLQGEKAGDSSTLSRFSSDLSRRPADNVLLMEGTNDIYGGTGGNPPGIPSAIAGLRNMIVAARGRGLKVFLATVPPANPAGPRGVLVYQTVPLLNAQIRTLANAEGVPLVDVESAIGINFALLSADGMHPNADGYATIAAKFFEVIRAQLEVAPTLAGAPSTGTSLSRGVAPTATTAGASKKVTQRR